MSLRNTIGSADFEATDFAFPQDAVAGLCADAEYFAHLLNAHHIGMNAATTYPKPETVYQSMDQFQRHTGGSFGRGNYEFSSSAKGLVDNTRKAINQILHCPAKQVVFEPSATISLNIIIQGIIKKAQKIYLLDERFTYRLALSATLERHRDEEGTALLYSFFGKKCIEYSLERAIAEDKLTPYKYYPVVVHLNDDELAAYEQLSYEMSKCVIKGKNGKFKLNKHGEILALRRARIVAGASEKLDALREEIKPYIYDNNILVYCGATNVLNENADFSSSDAGDIRQIEAVTRILGNEFGMAVAQFTSKENMETRASIKEQFQRGDRLQSALIQSIICSFNNSFLFFSRFSHL